MFGKRKILTSGIHAIATIAFSLALLLATFVMPSPAQAAGKAVHCEYYHTVQQGEHIASIADHYSVDYYTIAADSGLKYPFYLAIGQTLCINGATLPVSQAPPATQAPASQAPPATQAPASQAPPATQAPASQAPPATQAPVSQAPPATQAPASQAPPMVEEPTMQAPPATQAPAPAQVAGPAPSGPQSQQKVSYSCTYVVKSGDRLSRIARYHGVSMRALAKFNGLDNINWIFVGQHLVVPC